MVRIVWGVMLVLLGSFVIWQAVDLLAMAQAGNDALADFSRSLGQRPEKGLDAYALTNFWGRVIFGVICLLSGSLLIYFGDAGRKEEISKIRRRIITDEYQGPTDW